MVLSRREFVRNALLGAAGASLAPSFNPFSLFGPEAALAEDLPPSQKTLVILTLYGGNDGLNMVVPFADPRYVTARTALALQGSEVLPITGTLGLHAGLIGLKKLFDQGQVAIVGGVGNPDRSFSHFRSMAIWQAGSLSATSSGWVGRWLEATGTSSLRAVAVSSSLPPMLTGDRLSGVSISSGQLRLPGTPSLRAGVQALSAPSPEDSPLAARAAAAHRELLTVSDTVSGALSRQGMSPSTSVTSLPAQLDLVARMIRAGMPTRVYSVALNGFDTHINQKGTQARLLAQLDAAVSTFFTQLAGDPYGNGTVMLVHSEFGRRVPANADLGTDHGAAGPVLFIGPTVKGGLYGEEPDLGALIDGNLPVALDFRSVYAAALVGVLGADPTQVLGPLVAPPPGVIR